MIKKAIIGTGVAVLAAVFFFGRDALSYVRTSVGHVKDSVKSSVPVDFEIERARQMIKDLEPDIQTAMHVIAKQEVEVERAQKQVADLQARLTKERAELEKLHKDAKSGKTTFEYCGRKYNLEQVKTDLTRRLDRLRTGEATLDAQQKSLTARERNLDGARKKLDGMLAARRQLQVDVENLDAQRQLIAAAQTINNYNFDDSQLGRAKELVTDLRTRLDIAARLANAEPAEMGEIQLNPEAGASDILNQIGEYLNKDKQPVAKAEENKAEANKLAKSGK